MHGSTATKHIIIGELPAGDYVLGDPKITVGNCASLQTFMDAYRASRLTRSQDLSFAASFEVDGQVCFAADMMTDLGDHLYVDQDGNCYAVESGMIAAVPVALAKGRRVSSPSRLISTQSFWQVVCFDQPINISFAEDFSADIKFGDVNLIRLYEDELDHLLCLEGTRGDKKAKPYDRKLLRLLEMNLIEFVSDDTVTLTGRGRNCVRHIRAQAIANSNQISVFLRCAVCLTELPANTSSREWAQLEVGWTNLGLQVWCKRHECNVMHIDFEGRKHPANSTRATEPETGVP